MRRKLVVVSAAALLLAGASGLVAHLCLAGEKTYIFTNASTRARNDIHIKFSGGTTYTAPVNPPFTEASGQGTNTHDFSGGTVAAAGTWTETFSTTGTGPTIQSGYWTQGGNVREPLSDANCSPWP